MDENTAIGQLRMAAINLLVGREVGADRLIQLGLDALLAGVEAPSLPALAGLTRAEEPEARDRFDRVVRELRLVPADVPAERTARTWALVRWWARLMLDGTLSVHVAGQLIYWHGNLLEEEPDADAVRELFNSIDLYDDTVTAWAIWDTDYERNCREAAADVLEEAKRFLAEAADDAP